MNPDETVQVLNEVADISQRLDILAMMFFITVIVILVGTLFFLAFYRFASSNAKADNTMNADLLSALVESLKSIPEALKQNNEQFIIIARDYRRNNFISNRILRGLNQVVVILEASNLIDTKQMQAIRDETNPRSKNDV